MNAWDCINLQDMKSLFHSILGILLRAEEEKDNSITYLTLADFDIFAQH